MECGQWHSGKLSGCWRKLPNWTTQWTVLPFVASVFDRIGPFAPLILRLCILLKTMWTKSGQQYDTKVVVTEEEQFLINSENQLSWKTCLWLDDILRKITKNWFACFLRCFSWVIVYSGLPASGRRWWSGIVICNWEMQNSPVKQQTIPKMELQAALYSVRLRHLITKDHDIHIQSVTQCTDSMTVL